MSTQSLKDSALNRISKIVDRVFEESKIYREEINRAGFMDYFSNRMENGLAPEELVSVTEQELIQWVRQFMAVDILSELLSDLTPEEMELFDVAVEGRQFVYILDTNVISALMRNNEKVSWVL